MLLLAFLSIYNLSVICILGYDEVIQHGNSLLKKSGINSLVSEAKSLNKSFSRDISFSALSQGTAISHLNNTTLLSTFDMQQLSACAGDLFQLDSGSTGDILGAEFWMREIMPQNFTDICKMWLKSSADCFIGENYKYSRFKVVLKRALLNFTVFKV